MGQEVGPGEEPATTEDVENIKHRVLNYHRIWLFRLVPTHLRGGYSHRDVLGERGKDVLRGGHGGRKQKKMGELLM
jgi:hypothetical protein